eukprot:TRINITY_DN47501_c0_g1_i1.p1 TRINITY_DN47501_c0_g1~~TRINITY_DN47501_c0_g1_i1.p1  ORF type:complete len:208 (+),score=92.06 TRINITY_DN47501_c0_g1_i1:54-626(+)
MAAAVAVLAALAVAPGIPRAPATLGQDELLRAVRRQPGARVQPAEGGAVTLLFDSKAGERRIDAVIGESDSLALRAQWDSPQEGLGDHPIANMWNRVYRFAKASVVSPAPAGSSGRSAILLTMDQYLPAELDVRAAEVQVLKSLALFMESVVAFDQFLTELYTAAQKQVEDKAAPAAAAQEKKSSGFGFW